MRNSPVDWNAWHGEMPATLMFIVRDGRILLIEKLRGLGAGKINGPGGKIESGETARGAVVRECQEELHITPLAPRKIGELWFAMSSCPDILCHVFRADSFSGTPTATDEAIPLWAPVGEIPFHRMWADDRVWMPLLLDETRFIGRFVFEDETMVWHEMETGVEFAGD